MSSLPLFWLTVSLPVLLAIVAPLALEALLQPRPTAPWNRPRRALALHTGLWLLAYVLLLVVLRRPWFACVLTSGLALLLTLVNNAKWQALREAFICQDFEYFTDMLRHPRLYLPFFGLWRAAAGVLLFAGVMVLGLRAESVWTVWGAPAAFWWGNATLLALALAVLAIASRRPLPLSFDPNADTQRLGYYAALWAYGWAESRAPAAGWPVTRWTQAVVDDAGSGAASGGDRSDVAARGVAMPQEAQSRPAMPGIATPGAAAPDIVVVQAESFFDARRLYDGIKPGLLPEYDALRAAAVCHGRLAVPSWGANTVRTEFGFLSGLPDAALGVHRFNPYRRLPRQGIVTLASWLRTRGYRTVCVHPYPASFYRRDKSYPLMGFDAFIDIRAFGAGGDRDNAGPYVSDTAVAERVRAVLQAPRPDGKPVFVFVITMENHGPLHLERADPADEAALYERAPPAGCTDLSAYLRHLRNADRMLGALRQTLQQSSRPGVLAFYGDHVPIMPSVYAALHEPDGSTDFFVWRSDRAEPRSAGTRMNLPAHELGAQVLAAAGWPQPVAQPQPLAVTADADDDSPPASPAPAASVRTQAGARIELFYPLPMREGRPIPAFLPLAASGRRFLFGRGEPRQHLLGPGLDAGRIIGATLDGKPVGLLSFRTEGRGPYVPSRERFGTAFGQWQGTLRYIAYRLGALRERRYPFYIHSIRVLPEARRQGVGAALLHEAERQARLLGAAGIDVDIFSDKTKSLSFFAGQGYVESRRVVFWATRTRGPGSVLVGMRREL